MQCIKSWDELREQEKTKDKGDHTGCCCAEFSNSIPQNPRIRSNNHTKTGSQEGKTGQGNQEKQQNPERRSAGYHSATVVPESYPNSLSLVRRNSYTITSSLLRTRRVNIDPYSSTVTKLSNPLYCCCCCLLMFQVAACISERVSGAAALFKVIVSSSLDFLLT